MLIHGLSICQQPTGPDIQRCQGHEAAQDIFNEVIIDDLNYIYFLFIIINYIVEPPTSLWILHY